MIVLLVVAPAKADLTTWIFGEGDAVTARVGMTLDPNNVEIGIASTWHPTSEAPQIYTVYGLYMFDQVVPFRQPLPVDFLPETLEAQPYIIGTVGIDLENEDRRGLASLGAGVIVQQVLVIEYSFQAVSDYLEESMADTHKVSFGLRWQF